MSSGFMCPAIGRRCGLNMGQMKEADLRQETLKEVHKRNRELAECPSLHNILRCARLWYLYVHYTPRNHRPLSVGSVSPDGSRQFRLPLVSVRKQFLCAACQLTIFKEASRHQKKVTHPCCRGAPPWSRWRTRRWATRQWRRRGRTPGRSRSRCTWSCQCRSGSSGGSRRHAPRPRS